MQSPNLETCEVDTYTIAGFVLGYDMLYRNNAFELHCEQVQNRGEYEVSNTMNTAEYIKKKLGATVIEVSLVPQENGDNILMERCEIDGGYKIVLISDSEADKTVMIC